jgi:hypothetical protein
VETGVAGSKPAFLAESLHYVGTFFPPGAAVIQGSGWADSCSFNLAHSSFLRLEGILLQGMERRLHANGAST